jgi:hypothetical protein
VNCIDRLEFLGKAEFQLKKGKTIKKQRKSDRCFIIPKNNLDSLENFGYEIARFGDSLAVGECPASLAAAPIEYRGS